MVKFTQEFRAFIKRGNVFDLAVAIIIGAAFGKIITSFVNDLFTPIISLIMGKTDITELRIILRQAQETAPELAIRYGMFIQTVFDFLVVGLVVFFLVKYINRLKRKEKNAAPPPAPSKESVLLTEIRDILKVK